MSDNRSRLEFRCIGSPPIFRAFLDGERLVFDSKGVGTAEVELGPHVFQFFAAGDPGTEFSLFITAANGRELWVQKFRMPSSGIVARSKTFSDRWPYPTKRI